MHRARGVTAWSSRRTSTRRRQLTGFARKRCRSVGPDPQSNAASEALAFHSSGSLHCGCGGVVSHTVTRHDSHHQGKARKSPFTVILVRPEQSRYQVTRCQGYHLLYSQPSLNKDIDTSDLSHTGHHRWPQMGITVCSAGWLSGGLCQKSSRLDTVLFATSRRDNTQDVQVTNCEL